MDKADEPSAQACSLTDRRCVPCQGGTPPLAGEALDRMMSQVSGWTLDDEKRKITKRYKFPDFRSALVFVNDIGNLAEREGHHPDLHLSWGKAVVELSTHKIKGLSENDFILAAKIDQLLAV